MTEVLKIILMDDRFKTIFTDQPEVSALPAGCQ